MRIRSAAGELRLNAGPSAPGLRALLQARLELRPDSIPAMLKASWVTTTSRRTARRAAAPAPAAAASVMQPTSVRRRQPYAVALLPRPDFPSPAFPDRQSCQWSRRFLIRHDQG